MSVKGPRIERWAKHAETVTNTEERMEKKEVR